eukprot:154783-Hanusia_phi.AAC.1
MIRLTVSDRRRSHPGTIPAADRRTVRRIMRHRGGAANHSTYRLPRLPNSAPNSGSVMVPAAGPPDRHFGPGVGD